jgi:heterodisulfide reductase subunit A
LEQKQRTKIGTAHVNTKVCVQCGLCVMECPRQIISKKKGEFPVVNADECIGCGACQNTCPVKAIRVRPVEKQKLL